MIAVDASALLAILLDEPEAALFLSKLVADTSIRISPVNWWEVQVRMRARYGEPGERQSAVWMESLGIVVEPVTLAQAQLAADAFARFRGRPARLSMGDCFAYALASGKGIPLLYKGGDFAATDIRSA